MVRAILDGRKTQTRRVVGPQPNTKPQQSEYDSSWGFVSGARMMQVRSPYGEAGDSLWVREAFQVDDTWTEPDCECIAYKADLQIRQCDSENGKLWSPLPFRLDGDPNKGDANRPGNWRPSIHMPRWASRITLEVTGVRVERVQEISAADCVREGFVATPENSASFARAWFQELWDSLNAKRGHSWESNPFCWVIDFRQGPGRGRP